MVILKPQSKLHDPTFFYGGLRADSFKNFARHGGASYDFENTYMYCSRKHARWLLDMHNNNHGFIAR